MKNARSDFPLLCYVNTLALNQSEEGVEQRVVREVSLSWYFKREKK